MALGQARWTVAPARKERSANSVQRRSASLIHLAKDRPTRQLSSQLQAQQANEHREKLFSKSKRKGRSGFSLIVCV